MTNAQTNPAKRLRFLSALGTCVLGFGFVGDVRGQSAAPAAPSPAAQPAVPTQPAASPTTPPATAPATPAAAPAPAVIPLDPPALPAQAMPPSSKEGNQAPAPVARSMAQAIADGDAEVIVLLKDGRQIVGMLEKLSPEEIRLRISGVHAEYPLEEVEKYELLPSIFERYRQFRTSAGDDPDQIVRLAAWLRARERYELALSEVQRVLVMDKLHAEARQLKIQLEEQIRLKSKSVSAAKASDGSSPGGVATKSITKRADVPLLSAEQIALIKVYEIDFADNPRLIIQREAIERMLDARAGDPRVPETREGREALLRKPAAELLQLMFELKARDQYSSVQVLDQPKSIASFRDSVARTWLTNSCATNQCHGGMEAGRLILATKRPGSDPTVYTNLLILSRFKTSRGGGAGGSLVGQPLINWENPERSPLLQMGLPRDQALMPHPEVPRGVAEVDAWKPVFRNKSDTMFKSAVQWLRSFHQPRTDWPIDYTPLRPLQPAPKPQAAQISPTTPASPATPSPAPSLSQPAPRAPWGRGPAQSPPGVEPAKEPSPR